MAPEQLRCESADPRSDLFNLGAILYEMLAGQQAFARDSAFETAHAIVHDEPPALTDGIPPEVGRVVRALVGYGIAAFAICRSSNPSCMGCIGPNRSSPTSWSPSRSAFPSWTACRGSSTSMRVSPPCPHGAPSEFAVQDDVARSVDAYQRSVSLDPDYPPAPIRTTRPSRSVRWRRRRRQSRRLPTPRKATPRGRVRLRDWDWNGAETWTL